MQTNIFIPGNNGLNGVLNRLTNGCMDCIPMPNISEPIRIRKVGTTANINPFDSKINSLRINWMNVDRQMANIPLKY